GAALRPPRRIVPTLLVKTINGGSDVQSSRIARDTPRPGRRRRVRRRLEGRRAPPRVRGRRPRDRRGGRDAGGGPGTRRGRRGGAGGARGRHSARPHPARPGGGGPEPAAPQ